MPKGIYIDTQIHTKAVKILSNTRKKTTKSTTTTGKRRGRPPKSAASSTRERPSVSESRRQLWAIILFGVSLILGVLTFLEGENLWAFLHKVFFGLFGLATYLIAPLALLIAILLAFEKKIASIKSKIIQASTLVLLLSGAFHIFFDINPVGDNFFEKLTYLFEIAVERQGGGIAGALFGWSLYALFGKVAAAIVIVIVIVIFLFITFGVTLSDIINFCKNSVKKPVEQIEKAFEEHIESREVQDDGYEPDIDINLGPDASKRSKRTVKTIDEEIDEPKTKSEKIKRAKQKLLGEDEITETVPDIPSESEAEEEPVQIKIDDLIGAPEEEGSKEKENTVPSGDIADLDQTALYSTGAENRVYTYPPITLLKAPKITRQSDSEAEMQQNAEILMDTLSSFGVKTRLLGAVRGPAVTRYELQPSAGVRISKITQLSNDIALNLAAT